MTTLNIILAAIVALAGIPVGLVLRKIAKDEIKKGIKYFIILKKILLTLIVIFILSSYQLNIFLFLFVGLVLGIIIFELNLNIEKSYFVFALLFIISLKSTNLLILTSSLIFLYGLPAAALIKKS